MAAQQQDCIFRLSSSPEEEQARSPRAEHVHKNENYLSDWEEQNRMPREYDLYGTTPPSSRPSSKPCREKSRSLRRRKEKNEFSLESWKRRQSESVTSYERAQNRTIKAEESGLFVSNVEEYLHVDESTVVPRQRQRSSTESSALLRKPSQRKYKTIRYKDPICSADTSWTIKGTGTSSVCPIKRLEFYDTLNVLMNLGQGANAENSREKVEADEDEKLNIEEPKEALWLELQAWHNSTTMYEQDEYLMNVRTNIIGILDSIINFKVDYSTTTSNEDNSSDSESDSDCEDSSCLLHIDDTNVFQSLDTESRDTSTIPENTESPDSQGSDNRREPELSEFAQNVKQAVTQVTAILEKLYAAEQLYPSRGALSREIEMYGSEEFHNSVDTLMLWLNVVKGMYHKLHVMSKLIHVDLSDEKVWGDWIDLGLDLKCVQTVTKCKRCRSTSGCVDAPQDKHEGLKRGLSHEVTSTSRYRHFVDHNIKRMGVALLGFKVFQILSQELNKACVTLQVNLEKNVFLKHRNLHILYHNFLVKNMKGSKPQKDFDPHNEQSYTVKTFGVPQANWRQRFSDMGLPSYQKLFVFLVRLIMDIYHECLRMRMDHRPKGEPSPLSVRQLLEECKEVLTAAVAVRQFFLDSMETIGTDLSKCPEVEEQLLKFDEDIQNMLEVYFEYLHSLMHILQRLPSAYGGVKNIMEEEWMFVKELAPYIRGGEVRSGKSFCVMACDLLQSTADFLGREMDEYLSALPDSDGDTKLRAKILKSCRELKKLFKEARERSVKALGFAKRLRNDLGVAATFHLNVTILELLEKLKALDYIQVIAKQSVSVMLFVRRNIMNSQSCINALLNACCGLSSQRSSCSEGADSFIILVASDASYQWTGDKIHFTPALDTSLGLVDIQVDSLAIVAYTSCELQRHLDTFQSELGGAVRCIASSTSCHHEIIDMENEIKESMKLLRCKICKALETAVESFDIDKMYEIEETERTRLYQSVLEALQFAFNAVFDFHREMKKIPSPNDPSYKYAGKLFLDLAFKWMDFVVKRRPRGKGRRPRWAVQGFKFLMEACHPSVSSHLSDAEFEQLQSQIFGCIDHVIGSVERRSNDATPTNQNMPWGPNSKFSRSSTFPGTIHSSPHPTRAFSEPGRPVLRRFHTMGHDLGESSEDEEIEYPLPRIFVLRSRLSQFEHTRQQQLLDKGVIGRVSNKKRDLAGELAVIPKRVPFKWQRGNKIGEGQFGKVYACVNLDSEEVVAMKQITFHPNDHSAFQDLADEIKAFEGLNHDSLVKYYGCEVHRDVMYIFMEYCGDGTISDVSKLGLPEAMIRKYTDQILVAVSFLHDRGIIHRDIKGPNIFLSSEGLIKLGDFGASVKLHDPSQTMCGEVCTLRGTIAYMAPEVINLDKGAGYGRAADIWSVGCVVVEMASGKAPWSEYDNQWAIMLKVGEGGSPSGPDGLSDEGKDFLNNCFVHNPHERWTARQLQNHTFLKFT